MNVRGVFYCLPMTGEFSIDHSTAAAWEAFRADLHATLLELGTDEITSFSVLETGEGHLSPYLQFFKGEGGVVLSEVSSNQVLTDRFRLTPGQIGELLRIGWAPPSPPKDQPQIPNFHLVDHDLEVAVARAQETLQAVFGIPHPQFLAPALHEDELHGVSHPDEDPHEGEEPLDPDVAYRPTSADDLAWAVSQSLRNHFGTYRPPNSSGAFAVKVGSAGMLVTPTEEGAVSVAAFVVQHMRNPERAQHELVRLNDHVFVRFHVAGTAILATCDIPALPFVPRHLYTILTTMGQLIDAVDDDLAEATGGSTLFGDAVGSDDPGQDSEVGSAGEDYPSDELPPELLTLVRLENEVTVELTPAVVATLMHHDRSLLLRCLRLAREQASSWADGVSEAESAGDEDEAEARRYESWGWEKAELRLRSALAAVQEGRVDHNEVEVSPGRAGGGPDGDEHDEYDDEGAAVAFMEHLSAWAHGLESEMEDLEPGESLVVSGGVPEGGPGAVLTISRYLESGLLARITASDRSKLGMPPEAIEHLGGHGWFRVPAIGMTGPDRLVLSVTTGTPDVALACLSGLVAAGAVPSLEDLSIRHASGGDDWRRLPPHVQVEVASFDELRSTVTMALEELGAHPALLPGITLESPAANFSVTVAVDHRAPRLHIEGPVVAGPDPELIDGGGATLPTSGFDWKYTGRRLDLTGTMDGSPFLPGHLEIVLAAAEDLILLHSRALAAELGGRSAIEDYLAEISP